MAHRPISDVVKRKNLLVLGPECSVGEAARAMQRAGVGAVMVVEGDRLVGLFTERDALCRVVARGRDADCTSLSEVMTRSPQTVSPERPFGYALHMMYEGGYRHLPVLDHGRPVGIVSARDMLGPELREFVCELSDKQRIAEILG